MPATRILTVAAVLAFISGLTPLSFAEHHAAQDPAIAAADSMDPVAIRHGRLFVGHKPFAIRGMNYNPSAIGSDIADPFAPRFDVSRIAALGANTIGTYNLGRAEWGAFSEIANGERFYDALYPVAETHNLKILVAYFSNSSIDWTDRTRVARVTAQFQWLVAKARDRRSTLMYLIGNEVFERLVDDAQRRAYASWIGEMVSWTHRHDPRHPVVYADSHRLPALYWLKTHAPALDVYGVNTYAFDSTEALKRTLDGYAQAWPGKPIMLHEWGTDSWNAEAGAIDEGAQAARVKTLAEAIDATQTAAYGTAPHPLVGSLYFAFTDEWRFVGPWTSQDRDAGWRCASCFDGRADEDYWGLTKAVAANGAIGRRVKPAYQALQRAWGPNVARAPAAAR
jgi:hypothetical protein